MNCDLLPFVSNHRNEYHKSFWAPFPKDFLSQKALRTATYSTELGKWQGVCLNEKKERGDHRKMMEPSVKWNLLRIVWEGSELVGHSFSLLWREYKAAILPFHQNLSYDLPHRKFFSFTSVINVFDQRVSVFSPSNWCRSQGNLR